MADRFPRFFSVPRVKVWSDCSGGSSRRLAMTIPEDRKSRKRVIGVCELFGMGWRRLLRKLICRFWGLTVMCQPQLFLLPFDRQVADQRIVGEMPDLYIKAGVG